MALTKIDDRGLKTPIDLLDNEKIRVGTGNDLQIYHSGSQSEIVNSGGDLLIQCTGDDLNLKAQDDVNIKVQGGVENAIVAYGDGGVELFYDNSKKFETISTGVKVSAGDLELVDNGKILCGNGGDLRLYHDATDSFIKNMYGDLYIHNDHTSKDIIFLAEGYAFKNEANSENMIVATADGAVELYHNAIEKLSTTSVGISVTGDIALSSHLDMEDGKIIKLGTGDDLQIQHTGSQSIIDDTGSGALVIRSNNAVDIKDSDNVMMAAFNKDAAVKLYYDGSKKFETTSAGATVTGDLSILDDNSVSIGTDDNLYIKHSNGHGKNFIVSSVGDLEFHMASSELAMKHITNGAVELYYDNVKKLETTSGGVNIPSGNLDIPDSGGSGYGRLSVGSGDDLQIYHDGSHSYITVGNTGNLEIKAGNNIYLKTDAGNQTAISVIEDGAVELAHSGTKRFETTSSGATVTRDANSGCELIIKNDNNSQNAAGAKLSIEAGDNCNNGGMLKLEQNGAYHTFESRANGQLYIADNGTTKAYLDSSGNLGISAGNLELASGQGIDFSAHGNAGGMTSELLDEYEEGTWTPSIQGSTTNPSGGASGWTYAIGKYCKVGRMLHISFYIYNNSKDLSDGNGSVQIAGLPHSVKGAVHSGWPRIQMGYGSLGGDHFEIPSGGAAHLASSGWQVNSTTTTVLTAYGNHNQSWGSGNAAWEISGNGTLEADA